MLGTLSFVSTIVYERGGQYTNEDVVWSAWTEICALYFPRTATTRNGPRWKIDREAYRGFPPQNPSVVKSDLIAIRCITQAQPGQAPQSTSRDYLWIECKAADKDVPSGWKNVLNEAAERLATAHANRLIFLIVSIRWKCLYFCWDPNSQAAPLIIYRLKSRQFWTLDPRIRALHNTGWISPLAL
jgi:hypothetical protein